MRTICLTIGFLCLAVLLVGQQARSATRDYRRPPRSVLQGAVASQPGAADRMQGAVADLSKDCGEKFQPQMGPQGDPVCVAKPAEKKEGAK